MCLGGARKAGSLSHQISDSLKINHTVKSQNVKGGDIFVLFLLVCDIDLCSEIPTVRRRIIVSESHHFPILIERFPKFSVHILRILSRIFRFPTSNLVFHG